MKTSMNGLYDVCGIFAGNLTMHHPKMTTHLPDAKYLLLLLPHGMRFSDNVFIVKI